MGWLRVDNQRARGLSRPSPRTATTRGAPRRAPRVRTRGPHHHREVSAPPPPSPAPPAPPPYVSRQLSVRSRTAACRAAVEALVTSPVAHHERAALGAARSVRLGAEGDRSLGDRGAGRKADGMASRHGGP